MTRRSRDGRYTAEQGLTLIELMVALLISSILIGFVFSIFTRMSVAYRAQTGVSDVQQSLRAARNMIVQEVRNAGFLIPNGFTVANPAALFLGATSPILPFTVENDHNESVSGTWGPGSPDKIRVFYADGGAAARITTATTQESVQVDDATGFAIGDLVVVVNEGPNVTSPLTGMPVAPLASYETCLVRLTNVALTTLTFDSTDSTFNQAGNGHCTFPRPSPATPVSVISAGSMIYRLRGAAFRINPDPGNQSVGVLEYSPSGELLANDFQPVGLGFVNLQLAGRYFQSTDTDGDLDGDGDAARDWYSGATPPPADAVLTLLSVSLAVRTLADLNLVPSQATPNFQADEPAGATADHNRLGDSPSFDLAGTPDASRPAHYQGNHIYRGSSVLIDMRNMGVGR